ncbi:hypothetical protein PDE_04296 [Penicillium oxalicum 114-2]|uniref:Uncharacterized protein n=1 Tax=Penicillium oxalicum (strain 114-2 / CGMCC 5302) TaxID=933388 RepID=S8B4B2_PENO1|nr:hypothetical protein PDE_04296 [Penicillium oxalicum 114-2]
MFLSQGPLDEILFPGQLPWGKTGRGARGSNSATAARPKYTVCAHR